MPLHVLEVIRPFAGLSLDAFVCIVAFYRRVPRRLPSFAVYLILQVLTEAILWAVFWRSGQQTRVYFWTFWAVQGLCVAARSAVIAEICYRVLSPFPGVWKACERLLISLAVVCIMIAAIATRMAMPYLTIAAERAIELSMVGILLTALFFCRYYALRVDRSTALIALGLGFYSLVEVCNNSFLFERLTAFLTFWSYIRQGSFAIADLFWIVALWKPLPQSWSTPELVAPSLYEAVSMQVSSRLRELNGRLEEMLR
jgi:hypothetical protein